MRVQIKQYAIEHFPRLYSLADHFISLKRYQRERNLIKGRTTNDFSTGKGLVYFTYYRCGSQFTKRVIDEVINSQAVDWKRLDFEGYFFHFEPQRGNLFERFDEISHCFSFRDSVYGPIYHPVEHLLVHPKHLKLCVLRDPRDVLVSHYFSTAFAHTVTSDVGLQRRREAAGNTVDEFALDPRMHNEILERYQALLGVFNGNDNSDNCLFIRYEDLMTDFSTQVKRLGSLMGAEIAEDWLRENQSEVSLPSSDERERVGSHRRSGKSGQYKSKLKTETVKILNEKFAEILEPWEKGC